MMNATERKVIVITTFVAACICFAPGQWVSGGALLLASAALFQWHRVKLRREAPPPAAPTQTEGAPGAS